MAPIGRRTTTDNDRPTLCWTTEGRVDIISDVLPLLNRSRLPKRNT
jgi:hypothetical protein